MLRASTRASGRTGRPCSSTYAFTGLQGDDRTVPIAGDHPQSARAPEDHRQAAARRARSVRRASRRCLREQRGVLARLYGRDRVKAGAGATGAPGSGEGGLVESRSRAGDCEGTGRRGVDRAEGACSPQQPTGASARVDRQVEPERAADHLHRHDRPVDPARQPRAADDEVGAPARRGGIFVHRLSHFHHGGCRRTRHRTRR